MLRLFLAVTVVLNFAALLLSSTRKVGFSVQTSTGGDYVAATTTPEALIASVSTVIAFFLVLYARGTSVTNRPAGILRRATALFTDLFVAIIALGSFTALIPLVVEGLRTGVFAWSFERTSTVPTDWAVGMPLSLLMIVGLTLYFAVPPVRGSETIAGHLLGIRIVGQEGTPLGLLRASVRIWLAFVALAVWPMTLILALVSDRSVLWHDKLTRSNAVRVTGEG